MVQLNIEFGNWKKGQTGSIKKAKRGTVCYDTDGKTLIKPDYEFFPTGFGYFSFFVKKSEIV